MMDLDQFRDRFEQIKSGPADGLACRKLMREICVHPWATAAERNAAQRLVNELDQHRRVACAEHCCAGR
jgi:hypothetical protein